MTSNLEQLKKHSNEFRKEIIELAPNVYLAVGYAAANCGMIVGEDSLVIVDTTESTGAAENVLSEFRKITALPVKTIIYTHSHRDHICGATVFAEGSDVEVIARGNFSSDLVGIDTSKYTPDKAMMSRTKRQFGIGLGFPSERINLGCGPGDRPMKGLGAGFIDPNLLVKEKHSAIQRSGVNLELIQVNGETPDHMIVWMPEHNLLFSGDNYYKSFPNLYAIRGTSYRDFTQWVATLDEIIALQPDVLAPGHTRPLFGNDEIRMILSDYKSAIEFVIEETAAGMNSGKTADEIAAQIQLPEYLADKPWLQEFYGTLAWASRAYFSGTVGWFDGNPTTLFPLSPEQEAENIANLAGGEHRLLEQATAAIDDNPQWALELSDRLLRLKKFNAEATSLKIQAMRKLADEQINATARNYYLSCAAELTGELDSTG